MNNSSTKTPTSTYCQSRNWSLASIIRIDRIFSAIPVLILTFLLALSSYSDVRAQACNVVLQGPATNPSACTGGSVSGGAGAYWTATFINGVTYQFSFNNNGNTQTGGYYCINGTQYNTATTTLSNLNGSINIGFYRNLPATTSWVATSASLTYVPVTPGISTGGGGTFCGTDNVTCTPTNGTAYWQGTNSVGTSTATSTTSQAVTSSGTYYYNVENGTGGCWSGTSGQAVTINTASTAPTAITGGQTICTGSTASGITVSGGSLGTGGTVHWYTGGCGTTAYTTGATITPSPTTTTTYYARYEDPAPCSTLTACQSSTVTVNTKATAPTSAGASATTICNGSSTTLSLSGGGVGTGGSAVWYTGGCGTTATGSATVSPTTSTTYYGRYEDPAPCSDVTTCQSIAITVNQKATTPTSASATPPTICNGSGSVLALSGGGVGTGGSIHWYTGSCGGTAAGTGSPTVTPGTTTTYYGRYEDPTPCSDVTTCQTAVVTVNSASTAPTAITGGQTICTGSTASAITVSGGSLGTSAVIHWYTGSCGGTAYSSGSASITPSPTTTTTYYARYEDPAPCSTLTACQSSTVTVNTKVTNPTSASASPATICTGSSTSLSLSGGGPGTSGTTQWYTGSCGGTAASATPSPTTTTTYYGRYEDPAPCSDVSTCQSVVVTVNQKATAPTGATATPATICNGSSSSLALTGGGAGTSGAAVWYTGSCGGTATGSSSVSPTTTTTYYGRYEDPAPCSDVTTCQTVTVTVNQPSTAPGGIGGTLSVCSGGGTTLIEAGGVLGTGANYQWGTGSVVGTAPIGGATSSSYAVTPSSTTTYWVSVTVVGAAPCPSPGTGATATVTVATASTAPTSITSSGTYTLCAGTGTVLTEVGGALGSGGATYQWGTGGTVGTSPIGGATSATYAVTPSSTTTYWVSVTGVAPCGSPVGGPTQVITVNPLPVVSAGATVAAICQGHTTAHLNGTYSGGATGAIWSDGGVGGTFTNNGGTTPSTTTYTATSTSGTPVTLTLTSTGGGCGTVTSSISETVYPNPVPSLSTSGSACTGSLITYTTDAGMSSYVWTIPGTAGVDYTLASGTGTSTSNTANITWITGGSKTVSVNYTNSNSCTAATATSNTQTINSAPTAASLSDVVDYCSGGHTAVVGITGGTSPYTFSLTCGSTYANVTVPYTVSSAGASSCTLYGITDHNNCPYLGLITGSPVSYSYVVSQTGSSGSQSQTCTIAGNATDIFYDPSGNIMAKVQNLSSTSMGSTTVVVTNDGSAGHTPTSPSTGYPDYSTHSQSYLQRHFSIKPNTSEPANVCLYMNDVEVDKLATASASDMHTSPAYYGTYPGSTSSAGTLAAGTRVVEYDGGAGSGTQETPGNHNSPPTVITSITATHNPTENGATYNSAWRICFNVSGFSGFYVYASSSHDNNALPVTLINFTATAEDNKYIQLDWSTATETDNSGFQIERSTDGNSYLVLGWVNGHGTSTSQNDYRFDDLTAIPGVVYYYRLKQVDVDGHYAYSNIVSAELTGEKGFSLETMYPNPANNRVSVGVISSVNTTASVTMSDMLGREVLKEDWPLSVGYNTNEFDLSSLAQGTYLVSITSGSTKSTKHLIITR